MERLFVQQSYAGHATRLRRQPALLRDDKLIVQRERMLGAMADGRAPLATQPLQLSSCGAGDDGIRLLGLPAFEHAGALQDKAAGLAAESSDHPLEANEGR